MIGAIIAVSMTVLAIVGAFVWFGVALRDAERKAAEARVSDTAATAALAIATADTKTHKARADYQEKRADALDQELETVAVDGDPAGARERVLRRQARAKATAAATAADGGSAELVQGSRPDPAVASGPIGDRLLQPGE